VDAENLTTGSWYLEAIIPDALGNHLASTRPLSSAFDNRSMVLEIDAKDHNSPSWWIDELAVMVLFLIFQDKNHVSDTELPLCAVSCRHKAGDTLSMILHWNRNRCE
jgi:hypothetical protein